jgi:hypothetical protein
MIELDKAGSCKEVEMKNIQFVLGRDLRLSAIAIITHS